MPSKGRKAASRQAGLKSRRKRRKGGRQEFEAGPTVSSRVAAEEDSRDASSDSPGPVAQPVRVPQVTSRASRAAQAAAAEAAAAHPYLAKELLRIGMVTGVILVILAVASVVLG
jgi:hypothetical protein